MERAGEIFATEEYGMFKKLNGNRDVKEDRVLSIIKSIQSVGYIRNPIIINEFNEVIDGQGRLEALKRLALPVHFIVEPGTGIKECIAMNIDQKNWKIEDYIKSYADTGNTSYIRLLQLVKNFQQKLGLETIVNTIRGKKCGNYKDIKSGTFTLEAEHFKEAASVLDYLKKASNVFGQVGGNKNAYFAALAFCYRFEEVDNRQMLEKIEKYRIELVPVSTMEQALDRIEAVYNKRAKTRVYIKTEYQKAMENRYSWYAKKYMKNTA